MGNIDYRIEGDATKIKKEVKQISERRKRMEAISYGLLEICVEKGLTIAEMTELSRIFPRLIKEGIRMIEQRTNFTVEHGQDWQG